MNSRAQAAPLAAAETTCRACKAPIYLAETPKGHRMPVDREPSPGGNVRLWPSPGGGMRCEVLTADQVQLLVTEADLLGGEPPVLRKSHFATCPQAKQHRR